MFFISKVPIYARPIGDRTRISFPRVQAYFLRASGRRQNAATGLDHNR
jgi:hypothetical protein